MPVLKNARYERFAQERAKGTSIIDAYTAAGYKADHANARRLSEYKAVKARIRELQSAAASAAVLTAQDIAKQLDDDRKFARNNNHSSAAVQATMGKAKVLGLVVDKQLQVQKRIEDMNEAELRQFLGRPAA